MSFTRLLVVITALSVLPVVALAQTATPPVAQPPLTQNAPVVEPNTDALKPPARPAMTAPKWSEFPTAPKNVPTVPDFAGRVHKEQSDSAQLDAIGKSIVWEAYQPAAINADVNARIDPAMMGPIDQELTPAQTEALAQSLRVQAAAPPVAQ